MAEISSPESLQWHVVAKESPELAMHRLFRIVHQRNNYVVREPSTNLSLGEAHMLTELEVYPDLTQRELGEILGISQTSLSQIGKALKKRGLLKIERQIEDKRNLKYRLTSRGKDIVAESDRVTDNTFALFSKSMTRQQQVDFVEFLKAIADGYTQPAGKLRLGEPAFRLQQRRVTRCFGLLESRAFGSNLSGTEWQVLTEIASHSGAILARDIEGRLLIPAPTLTFVLRRLEAERLIIRKSSDLDARKKNLYCTAKGLKLIQGIEAHAREELTLALGRHSRETINYWVSLLAEYALGHVSDVYLKGQGASFQIAHTSEQKRVARTYLLNKGVSEGHAEFFPDQIAGPEDRKSVV